MARHILLVEDDIALGDRVRALLVATGFEVVWWRQGREIGDDDARELDLVVLDLMLPGMHGLDILRGLRERGHHALPVLVLSARDDSENKVRALRLGADDFVSKPFWPDELVERVRARLRRPSVQVHDALRLGPLVLDGAARSASHHGTSLDLTRAEFDIVLTLARRLGEVVSRKELASRALDPERESGPRALDVHISNVRRKLAGMVMIETVWGIGYRIARPAPSEDSG